MKFHPWKEFPERSVFVSYEEQESKPIHVIGWIAFLLTLGVIGFGLIQAAISNGGI